jgi:predicted ATP-binding protein involved in virulence
MPTLDAVRGKLGPGTLAMKLESLKLTNFRGFREFEITFDPSFTVLLGGNMAGKSAVLDATALVLTPVLGPPTVRDIEIRDDQVHQVVVAGGRVPQLQKQFPVVIETQLLEDGRRSAPQAWHVRLDEGDLTRVNLFNRSVLNRAFDDDLPVLAHYGVQRHWDSRQPSEEIRGLGSRQDGYVGCFATTSTHATLSGWIRRQTLVQLQKGDGYVQPQLAAVEAAIKCCINEVTRIWFDVQYDELHLERSNGDIQSFSMLSEGYRNMVAMVADIAWRASVLNPQHGPEAHQRTEGVVLIDELDLHLHPSWQRRIVADLRRTFPKIQFIVTTHSPQIVASVTRDQIRLLDRNQLIASKPYVEGRDSNEILEDVFGVPKRPEPVQAEIDALYRLIEDEDFVAARARLAMLEEHLGPEDAAMIRARWILDTEDPPARSEPSPSP